MDIGFRKIAPYLAFLGFVPLALLCSADEFPLKSMDADSDGQVSAEEHADGAREKFRRMDLDHDDVITAEELDAARRQEGDTRRISSEELIVQIDTNRDGELTPEEDAEGAKLLFEQADQDGDGKVDAESSIFVP